MSVLSVRSAFLTLLYGLLIGYFQLSAQSLDDLFNDLDKKGGKSTKSTSLLDDLIDGKAKGYPFDLVPFNAPDEAIDGKLFWRTYKGMVTASAIPDEFSVDGEPIMQTTVGQSQVLDGPQPKLKPTTGSALLEKPDHVLNPGRIKIVAPGGDPECDHAAVLIRETPTGKRLSIRLAPVVFESLTEDGEPVAFHPDLVCAEKPLLSKSLKFRKLTMWLPIDLTYDSDFGRFRLAHDGSILYSADEFPKDVTFTGKGFLKKYPPRNTSQRQPIEDPEFLTFRKGSQNIRFFASLQVAPGKPLLIGISNSQYKSITGSTFSPRDIYHRPRDQKPVYGRKLSVRDEGLVNYVSERLNCDPLDIVWTSLEIPLFDGPAWIDFNINSLGRVRHNFAVVEPSQGLHLHPHRGRTAFASNENTYIHLFVAPNFPGGTVTISVKPHLTKGQYGQKTPVPQLSTARKKPIRLEIPANPETTYDSHLLKFNTSALPPGSYSLQARHNGEWISPEKQIQIIQPTPKSDFTAYLHSWFINLSNSQADRLFQLLQSGNYQFIAENPRLQATLPYFESHLYRQISSGYETAPPAELLLRPSYNDNLLNTLQKYGLGHIDYAPLRRDSINGEGYSYYHTYQPSVERQIRRLHIFSEQVRDYPNVLGSILGIDTRHQGSRRNFGPSTDAHLEIRNDALEKLLTQQGSPSLSIEDQRFIRQTPTTTSARKKLREIIEQDITHWHAAADATYTKHNKIYQESMPEHPLFILEEADYSQDHSVEETFFKQSIYFAENDESQIPMSAAFLTDWAKAHAPDRPVWLTTKVDGHSEGQVKNLLHGLARGLQGGGLDMDPNEDFAELQRRATFMQFITQYGTIAKHAKPNSQIAFLATTAKLRHERYRIFDIHAAYNFFTRLGHPPSIIHERQLGKSSPKFIVIVNEQYDLLSTTLLKLKALQQSGTKIVAIGKKPVGLTIDYHIPTTPQTIFQNPQSPGYNEQAHPWLWSLFHKHRPEFEAFLKAAKLTPLAQTDPTRAYALTLDDGPIRYVAVIADRADSHPSKFAREPKLPVTLQGEWKVVRDLRLQQDLPTSIEAGKTTITVPLETEPCTLLVLLPSSMESFGKYPAPVLLKEYDEEENLRETRFTHSSYLSGEPRFHKREVQELITGITQTITASKENPVAPITHVASPAIPTLPLDVKPEVILLEAIRDDLYPLAEKLAADLDIPLWKLEPDHFDEHPFRWYPKAQDDNRIQEILQSKIVGYRKGLSPVLDTNERHKPELGGYRSINPPYMVGKHCLVFSGGELGNSLRDITSWIDTPSSPGRGQGRILNLRSAFYSGKNTIALVANDLDGYNAAAKELTRQLQQLASSPTSTFTHSALSSSVVQAGKRLPVPTPFTNYSAHRHTAQVLATNSGYSAIEFSEDNGVALIGKNGTTSIAIKPSRRPARLLEDGSLWTVEPQGDRQGHTNFRLHSPKGELLKEFQARNCWHFPDGAKDAPTVTPDGKTAIFGTRGNIHFLNLEDFTSRQYNDATNVPHKYSAFYPRVPVASMFSSNGRYYLTTLDSRPPISGLSRPSFTPTYPSALLFDLQSDTPTQPLWILDAGQNKKATHAVHQGFGAVSDNGLSALTGFEGIIFLVDPEGNILAEHKAVENQFAAQERKGPKGGVSTSIDSQGKLAAFAFRTKLFISTIPVNASPPTSGKPEFQILSGEDTATTTAPTLLEIPVEDGLFSMLVSQNGSKVYYTTDAGELIALNPDGQEAWRTKFTPDIHLSNAPGNQLFAADGTGTLHLISQTGKILKKNNIWLDAMTKTTSPIRTDGFRKAPPSTYTPPQTLSLAKEHLNAKPIKQWTPKGDKRLIDGKTFYHTSQTISFETGQVEHAFLNIVYRLEQKESVLNIEVQGNGQHPFKLDLETFPWREVNIPIQGPNAKVTIHQSREIGIAECTLYSIQWPGRNVALQSKQNNLLNPELPKEKKKPSLVDDLLLDLEPKQKQKTDLDLGNTLPLAQNKLRVWWPNTDAFNRDGPFRTPQVTPQLMVDGFRYGISKDLTPAWANYNTHWGASFTIDFEKAPTVGLVATYDRTTKQSELTNTLQVFTGPIRNQHDSPTILGTRTNNDQFWQLFPIESPRKLKTIGVHAFRERGATGLSEIEVYGK